MPGPFESTGAVKGPTKFGALHMGARQFTGLVTQKSPYRDGAVPYLVGKFYGGTRFDTIWDGLNREITQRLTDARSPGSRVYNNNTFPAIASFYPWKYIQSAAEIVRVIVDGADGTIYDATAGQKTALFAKTAGAGPTRFLGVNTELFFGDGVDTKKILRSSKVWKAATSFNIGDFIIDSNGNIQSVQTNPVSYTISNVQVVDATGLGIGFWVVLTFPVAAPTMQANRTCSFSGLTTYVALNGQTLTWRGYGDALAKLLNLNKFQIAFDFGAGAYGPAADTGTMVALTATPGISGGAQPAWSAVWGTVTNDGGTNGGVNWTCFGSPVENWGITAPAIANPSWNTNADPTDLVNQNSSYGNYLTRFWRAQLVSFATAPFSILDPNGNIQVWTPSGAGLLTGDQPPDWSAVVGGTTGDRQATWINYGQVAPWYAATDYGGTSSGLSNPCVVLDSNGNLQITDDITTAQASSAGPITWATVVGTTTTDGTITWTCVGGATVLWSGQYQYSWSAHGIDGTVSTAAPVTLVANGGVGLAGGFKIALAINLAGTSVATDLQIDQIYIWRTAQGKPTLIQLDAVPNPFLSGQHTVFYDDVSTDLDLNAFIPAPVAESADPPQAGMTAPVYYLQRIWGIVDNTVVYSGGPDTITGNGNTTFPPLNEIPFPAQPIRLFPVLVQNGGLLVMTTSGVKIILGTGTPTNPFYVGDYLELVSVLNYDAVNVFYNQIFCMESNGKVSSLAIEYPFNPQSGYTEIGFPIGDQFVKTTTGGQNSQIFNPATAYLSWNANSSADTGMYVSSGTGFWFRMSLINPPESGILWSPLRQLQGGASAVQSVETSPGIRNLLIGPPAGTPGPILMRDTTGTVWTDLDAGVATKYPGWDAKGVTLLCSSGQFSSIKHVSAKSVNTGGPRPIIGVLFNEIQPSPERPYINMTIAGKGNDPPRNRESLSVYSDRYRLAQQGQETTGDCILVKFDYGTEAFGDELLDWAIYGAVHEEDEEQAAKV